jgi:hypothetical protein
MTSKADIHSKTDFHHSPLKLPEVQCTLVSKAQLFQSIIAAPFMLVTLNLYFDAEK